MEGVSHGRPAESRTPQPMVRAQGVSEANDRATVGKAGGVALTRSGSVACRNRLAVYCMSRSFPPSEM